MLQAAIVGGTGYGAVELIRLLQKHPNVQLKSVISHSQSGTEINEVYPHLTDILNIQMDEWNIQKLKNEVDAVFFATPSGVSSKLVPHCIDHGLKCIDLSGDFRLYSQDVYSEWYEKEAPPKQYLKLATYGLTEIYEEEIKNSSFVANPGCYPTATLLGLIPAIKAGLVKTGSIIVDGKSGVSGAGKSLSLNTHFSEINENIKAYKVGKHQHIPEIEQFLTKESDEEVKISFTTHMIPMTRGIMCTIYFQLTEQKTTSELIELYSELYKNKPFVRIRKEGAIPTTKEVLGSNFCDIGLFVDERTNRCTVISVIDNLVKGAAGQAIQNLNVMYGWDEQTGLRHIPLYP